MRYTVESRTLPEQPTAARRAILPADQVGPWLADTYAEVGAYLLRTGTPMNGPPYARFIFGPDGMDVEAGFPVPEPVAGDGTIEPSNLPGGTAAVTTHYGPYEALEEASQAIGDWLAQRGLTPSGAHWEIYYSDPAREPDPARWRTDVITPYAAGAPE